MLPGAEFGHPLVSRAGLRMEAARKAEHRHCTERRGLAGFLALLSIQPCEQPPRVRIVQPPDFFNRHFDCAHGGKLNKSLSAGKR